MKQNIRLFLILLTLSSVIKAQTIHSVNLTESDRANNVYHSTAYNGNTGFRSRGNTLGSIHLPGYSIPGSIAGTNERPLEHTGSVTFTSTPASGCLTGAAYSYTATATASSGQPISYSSSSLPSWLKLENKENVSTAIFSLQSTPAGMTTDPEGNIYISDYDGTKIYKIAKGETTATEWGARLAGRVYDIMYYNGYLYLARTDDQKVTKIDVNNPFSGETTVISNVVYPMSLAMYNGFMYVSVQSKILKVNLDNNTFTNYVTGINANLEGIAFDKNGLLYIGEQIPAQVSTYDGTTLTRGVITGISPLYIKIDAATGDIYLNNGYNLRKYEADHSSFTTLLTNKIALGMTFSPSGELLYGLFNEKQIAAFRNVGILSGTPASKDIGVHNITLTATAGSLSEDQNFTVTVSGPAVLDNFGAVNKTYGDAPFTVTDPTSANTAGAFVYTIANPSIATIDGKTVTILKTGRTSIKVVQQANGNYLESQTTAVLTVYSKSITLDVGTSPAITKLYDGNDKIIIPNTNYILNGVLENDEVTVNSNTTFANKDAGINKTINITNISLSGAQKDRYKLVTTAATASGTIMARPLTVTAAAGQNKVYGEEDPVLAYTTGAGADGTGGLLEGDALTGLLGRTEGKNAGVYAITKGNISAGSNYAITFVPADFTITARPLTITATAGQSKMYGQSDPVLTYTASPALLIGDVFSGSLTRENGKNAGIYSIMIGSLSAGANYHITKFTPAGFSITPAPLLITAEDKTKMQGMPNPVFTFSYAGLAEGDTPSSLTSLPRANTVAGSSEQIGYYDITAAGAASLNYTISYAPGRLTIIPAGNSHLKSWPESNAVLQIRIYAETAQSSVIALYTGSGQRIISKQLQLQPGINNTTIATGNIAPGVYILNVTAARFKEAQRTKIK